MKQLYWKDPDGKKEHLVNTLEKIGETYETDIYLITYNEGVSEAEVFGNELELR